MNSGWLTGNVEPRVENVYEPLSTEQKGSLTEAIMWQRWAGKDHMGQGKNAKAIENCR